VYDGVDHPLWMWDRVADAGVYFELDCIGNVRRLRGGARYGAGAALPSDLGGYKYSAFGRAVAADAGTPAPVVDGVSFAQPLRWQGRWLDTATGIYDVRNRQWSPELGAFLSPDDFVFFHTQGTLWAWPGQNPLRNRDPWGLVVPTPKPDPWAQYFGLDGWFTFMDVGMFMFSSAFDAAKAGNYGDAALDAAAGSSALLLAESNVALEAWLMAGMPGLGAALGPKTCPNPKVYHYTSAKNAAAIQRRGLFSQSSATNVGTYSAQEAVEKLGVKTPPEVVVEIQNSGQFVPNAPPVVPPHPLGPGGGADLTNPKMVGPECILCVNPIEKL